MGKFLFAIVFGFMLSSNAQSDKNVENLFRLNALAPGVSYELGIGMNSTLNFEAAIMPIAEGDIENNLVLELFPMLGVEFRYFTNIKRRLAKAKNTLGNSGNYVSFLNQAFFTAPILGNIEYDEPIAYLGAFNYGLQRTYDSGFYFSVAGGPGFFSGDNDPRPVVYLDARVGWVIARKSK